MFGSVLHTHWPDNLWERCVALELPSWLMLLPQSGLLSIMGTCMHPLLCLQLMKSWKRCGRSTSIGLWQLSPLLRQKHLLNICLADVLQLCIAGPPALAQSM